MCGHGPTKRIPMMNNEWTSNVRRFTARQYVSTQICVTWNWKPTSVDLTRDWFGDLAFKTSLLCFLILQAGSQIHKKKMGYFLSDVCIIHTNVYSPMYNIFSHSLWAYIIPISNGVVINFSSQYFDWLDY